MVSVSRTISRTLRAGPNVAAVGKMMPRAKSLPALGIVATARRIARTWARAASKPCEVSTTKSARRRFSASGICLARMASNFSSVMPGRSRTRSRWTSAGAETTTTASQRWSPPVSNSSGMSSTAIAAAGRGVCEEAPLAPAPADARSPRAGAARRRRRARAPPASRGRPCRPRWCRETPPRSAAPPRPHRADARRRRRRRPARPRRRRIRRGRLAHADRAGQPEDEHASRAFLNVGRAWYRISSSRLSSVLAERAFRSRTRRRKTERAEPVSEASAALPSSRPRCRTASSAARTSGVSPCSRRPSRARPRMA